MVERGGGGLSRCEVVATRPDVERWSRSLKLMVRVGGGLS